MSYVLIRPGSRRSGRWVVVGLLGALGLVADAVPASASSPNPVLTSNLQEQAPAGGGGFLFWSQNSAADKTHYTLFAKKGANPKFRVNALHTQGWMGGIDGSTVAYQQTNHRNTTSDIFLFDLVSKTRTKLPAAVNTAAYEYWPSISGDFVTFGRLVSSTHTRRAILFDSSDGSVTTLDSVQGRNTFLGNGQVNGNFAVWDKCNPQCNVFERDIDAGTTTKVGNPLGKYQYGEAVAPNGTVYFARSGQGCGTHVTIVKDPVDGPQMVLFTLADGIDLARMHVVVGSHPTAVLFDHYTCSTSQYDVYRFTA
jgi:hypothetical protein